MYAWTYQSIIHSNSEYALTDGVGTLIVYFSMHTKDVFKQQLPFLFLADC